jgi:GyrI-like small molecule binding domain
MPPTVEVKQLPAHPIEAAHGHTTQATLPANIRALFNQFYTETTVPKADRGLNVILYSACVGGEFDIACGVLIEQGGNATTPAGRVATTVHLGPYDRMKPAHDAIHQWAKAHNRPLAGPSWEIYGHWTDDPDSLRTDIFYLLA